MVTRTTPRPARVLAYSGSARSGVLPASSMTTRRGGSSGLPVVATHPVQFATADDYEAHEARVCIAEGEILGNPRRVRKFTRDQYFKSAAEMEALFADVPSAVANTLAIARRCSLTLVLGKPQMPDLTPRWLDTPQHHQLPFGATPT